MGFQLHAAEMVQVNKHWTASASISSLSATDLTQVLSTENALASGNHFVKINSLGKSQRFEQHYQGVPVWGHQVVFKASSQSNARIMGSFIKKMDQDLLNINPNKNWKASLEKAKQLHQMKSKEPLIFEQQDGGLYIHIFEGMAKYTHVISFFSDSKKHGHPSKPIYFIDAQTGELIEWFESLNMDAAHGPGGNEKVGRYEYGSDFDSLKVTKIKDGHCTLENDLVETINLNHSRWSGDTHSFDCENQTDKSINGAYSPLNDAHFFGGVVFDMYNNYMDASPLSSKLKMRVHYGNSFENAFWDGRQMTFGDGQDRFYPLVSLDVISHEVSHGYTQQNSGLVYRNQSGGINEAFSDIAGEAAEYFMNGENDFMVGFQIMKSPDEALRYFEDPTRDNKSIGHADDYTQGMNVHYSSGVFNRAFFLMISEYEWDVEDAFKAFAIANRDYWGPSTDYIQGAEGVVAAAIDLEKDASGVIAAFSTVGVEVEMPDEGFLSK